MDKKRFHILVEETLSRQIEVWADDRKSALEKAEVLIQDGEIILNHDDDTIINLFCVEGKGE